jgi:hypothetical protein
MGCVQVQDSHSSHCSWTCLVGALAVDSEHCSVVAGRSVHQVAELGTPDAGYEGLLEGLFAAVSVSTLFSDGRLY